MLVLHTSDWHLGRTLHRHDLSTAQSDFIDHIVDVVRAEHVDVVLLSGDVHDRALPRVEAMKLFDEALRRIRDAGATIVAISGNHDAPARLGDKAGLLDPRIQIRTDPRRIGDPVIVSDAAGPVAIYPIPYLEPAAVRHTLPDVEDDLQPEDAGGDKGAVLTHAGVLRTAMRAVHADRRRRGGRSIVLAHTWVTGGAGSDSERDITVGGLANVPASLFDGVTYTALGHLHRPQSITEALRYSGSPLPYSFSEAGDVKTSWLVELDADGLGWVEAIPVPVHRGLTTMTGHLTDLLTDPVHGEAERDFVAAVLTDPERPVDAMSRLQDRFPYAVTLSYAPERDDSGDASSYTDRLRGRSELEVAESFVAHVRTPPHDGERALLAEALTHALRAENGQEAA